MTQETGNGNKKNVGAEKTFGALSCLFIQNTDTEHDWKEDACCEVRTEEAEMRQDRIGHCNRQLYDHGYRIHSQTN